MIVSYLLPVIIGWIGFEEPIRIDQFFAPVVADVDVTAGPGELVCVIWNGWDWETAPTPAIWSVRSLSDGDAWGLMRRVTDEQAEVGGSPPAIACDEQGRLYVAWTDNRGPESNATYYSESTDGGTTWLQPNMQISAAGENADWTDIACSPDGASICVVHNALPQGRVHACYSLDGGLTWAESDIGDDTSAQFYPSVCNLGGDDYLAVWADGRTGGLYHLYGSISQDGGETWLHPNIPIPSQRGNPDRISLCRDGNVVHLMWVYNAAWNDRVMYQKSSDGGLTWLAAAQILDDGTVDYRQPGGVCSPLADEIVVAWTEGTGQTFPSSVRVTASFDSGESWEGPIEIPSGGEKAACTCALSAQPGDSRAFLAWTTYLTERTYFSRGEMELGVWDDIPLQREDGISVIPNPSGSMVDLGPVSGVEDMQIYDLNGRLVAEVPVVDGCASWDPQDSPAGVYIVRALSQETALSAKAVIVH